jgi:hypothetical protein
MALVRDTVVVVGGDGSTSTEIELRAQGLDVEHVARPAPTAITYDHLALLGARPDPKWSDAVTGRTITVGQIAQVLAHHQAWSTIVANGRPAAVLEAGCPVPDGFAADLADLLAAMAAPTGSLTGEDEVSGLVGLTTRVDHADAAAYALTPEAAAWLLGRAPLRGMVPVADTLRRSVPSAPIKGFTALIDPSRRDPGHCLSSADDAVYRGHLVVLAVADDPEGELGPPGTSNGHLRAARSASEHGLEVELVDWLADGLALLDAHTLVLAVPETALIAASAVEILDAYARHPGAVVLSPDEEAVLGPCGRLRELLRDEEAESAGAGVGIADADADANDLADVDVDEAGLVVDREGAVFADAADGPVLAINGRLLLPATGARPLVLSGSDGAALAAAAAQVGDTGSRDLARLLRYDGAADAAPVDSRWSLVAPDIVEVPFWTPEMCASVVRAAEAVGRWAADADDPVPAQEISLATISPVLFQHVEDHLGARVWPILRQVWSEVEFAGIQDAFVVKFTAGGASSLRLHHDVAQVSASVALNAGYEGGQVVFPRQGYGSAAVPIGHLLAWPSLVTHPHRSTPVTRGVRYSLVIWCRIPGIEL